MFKYLLFKTIFPVSDVNIVKRSRVDMAFKFFLDKNPEDDVIDPSPLTKFRRQRLKDDSLLDLLINKTVQIAKEKYMKYYNNERYQRNLKKMTPVQYRNHLLAS